MFGRPPGATLFPYTTLFRSDASGWYGGAFASTVQLVYPANRELQLVSYAGYAQRLPSGLSWEGGVDYSVVTGAERPIAALEDRKSTRLNSSHTVISYAVFCLNVRPTTGSYTLSLHDALPI